MEVDFALLAPYAELSPDGRVSLISGGLDTIHLPRLDPASAAPLYLAARLSFRAEECRGGGAIRVEMIDPNGGLIDASEHQVDLPPPAPGQRTKISFLLTFRGSFFRVVGEHRVRLLFNGEERKVLPLSIVTAEHPPRPEPH
jgi:hypothetical protein